MLNAGGIVAYYPSRFRLHYHARLLGSRDLYGERNDAAHKDAVVVLARMDRNRATGEFYRKHPDWFAFDSIGQYRQVAPGGHPSSSHPGSLRASKRVGRYERR
jgi:hypothetical protein